MHPYRDICLHEQRNKLEFKDEFHGWGVTDKGNRLNFYFRLIKYMLNSIRYFKGLVLPAAFLIKG